MEGESNMHSEKFRDLIFLIAWAGGILILGGLLWFFTQNFRDSRMISTINKVLAEKDDQRRLNSRIKQMAGPGKAILNNQRFTLVNSRGLGVVFIMYDESVPASCLALLNESGVIDRIIPLDSHSAQLLGRFPAGKLDMYKKYIEENERLIREREK